MANAAAKKRAQRNTQIISTLNKQQLLFLIPFLLIRVIWWWPSFTWLHIIGSTILLIANWYCFSSLKAYAKPSYSESGELIDGGADLDMKGLVEYHWDVLYITWFCFVTTLISDWFWLVFLVVPAFALYKIWFEVLYPTWQAKRMMEQQREEMNSSKGGKKTKVRTRKSRN
eukprot:TRINITY_DN2851_c0_g1_i4.p1 TRINITY_DN2851_c0_g1~~TRINITY_DN2851_c0_g1_i4.p1  ORF type:complete len:186 (+),score=27.32 TRINITY_DN2851_c0_g1_i4:48-560(+)